MGEGEQWTVDRWNGRAVKRRYSCTVVYVRADVAQVAVERVAAVWAAKRDWAGTVWRVVRPGSEQLARVKPCFFVVLPHRPHGIVQREFAIWLDKQWHAITQVLALRVVQVLRPKLWPSGKLEQVPYPAMEALQLRVLRRSRSPHVAVLIPM